MPWAARPWYVLSVRAAAAKDEHQNLSPVQQAGDQAGQIPLFPLINRPLVRRIL